MKKKLCYLLSAIIFLATSTASFAGTSPTQKINPGYTGNRGLDNFLQQADATYRTSDTIKYSYSKKLNCIITEQVQDNGIIKFTINEHGKKDTVKINRETNEIYVNDKPVKYTYEVATDSTEAPIVKSGAAKVRYHNSKKPAYGKKSNYTYKFSSKNVSDIQFVQAIGSLAVGTVLLVISAICPWVGGVLSVASSIKAAFDAKNTKHLSCKDKVYRHKNHKNGWYRGHYCEMHKTTWYPEKNYGGAKDAERTTTFRNGVVI